MRLSALMTVPEAETRARAVVTAVFVAEIMMAKVVSEFEMMGFVLVSVVGELPRVSEALM